MSPALGIVDIIAKAKDILVKLARILERCLHLDSFALSFIVDDIMQNFLLFI